PTHLHTTPPRCSLFLDATLQPPTPTLLPYPTLFRSPEDPAILYLAHSATVISRKGITQRADMYLGNDVRRVIRPLPRSTVVDRTDRKSTRLNSSHVKISYAVFCSKTKNSASLLTNPV